MVGFPTLTAGVFDLPFFIDPIEPVAPIFLQLHTSSKGECP
jgi:hypothetical protein